MREVVEYLTNILNIKTDSELVIIDMLDEIRSIKNMAEYRQYIRANINHLGMDYMTGFQKFILLTKKYKEKVAREDNAGRIERGNKYALELADKVRSVSGHVLDKPFLDFDNFVSNGKSIFTDFDKTELSKIGSLSSCANLQRSQSGKDMLFERLCGQMEKIVINKAISAPKTETTVLGMILGATNKTTKKDT